MVQAKTHRPIRTRQIFVLGLLLVRISKLIAEAVGGMAWNKPPPLREEQRVEETES